MTTSSVSHIYRTLARGRVAASRGKINHILSSNGMKRMTIWSIIIYLTSRKEDEEIIIRM